MYFLIKKLNVKICIFETLTDEVTNSNLKKIKAPMLLAYFLYSMGNRTTR